MAAVVLWSPGLAAIRYYGRAGFTLAMLEGAGRGGGAAEASRRRARAEHEGRGRGSLPYLRRPGGRMDALPRLRRGVRR